MGTYVLIATDAQRLTRGTRAAYSVAADRLQRKVWPLYYRTSFARSIASGDVCYIYAAGSQRHRQSIVGRATVETVTDWSQQADWYEHDKLLTDTPEKIIHFSLGDLFEEPVSIRPLLSKLDLTGRRDTAWGSFFQGGVKKLTEHDVQVLAQKTL